LKSLAKEFGVTGAGLNCKQIHLHSQQTKQNSEILLRDLKHSQSKPLWIIQTKPKPVSVVDKSKSIASQSMEHLSSSSQNNWKGGLVSEHLRKAKLQVKKANYLRRQ